MGRGLSYIIKRDFGFAPNPFHGVLTLATCKPKIRAWSKVGDFVIGNSSKEYGNKLIYMAKVAEIITFDDYWNDSRFQCKKPVMNGSFKTLYGDNIYHQENGQWKQSNSHHSLEDGSPNYENIHRDTGTTDKVLICPEFFYLGKSMIDISSRFDNCIHYYIGQHAVSDEDCLALWDYLSCSFSEKGLIDLPLLFKSFSRYDGRS